MLSKNVNSKKSASKIVFINEKNRTIQIIFDVEN